MLLISKDNCLRSLPAAAGQARRSWESMFTSKGALALQLTLR